MLALIAGGSGIAVATLGIAMLALQLSIGAANDVADVARDRVSRPTKPIPAGIIAPRVAVTFVVGSAALGLVLSATRGPATLLLAAAGLGVGLAYDLRLKATPWSWVPLAAGIPLVPLYAWVGAVGTVPPTLAGLALLAVPAGAGLAVANALADEAGDRAAGARTVATALGAQAAWWVATLLLAATYVVAVWALVTLGAGPTGMLDTVGVIGGGPAGGAAPGDAVLGASAVSWVTIAVAGLLLACGAWLGRGPALNRRRAGWGVEGAAVVVLATGWVGALAAAGLL